jgi:hypothetical protein
MLWCDGHERWVGKNLEGCGRGLFEGGVSARKTLYPGRDSKRVPLIYIYRALLLRHSAPRNISLNVCIFLYLIISLYGIILAEQSSYYEGKK